MTDGFIIDRVRIINGKKKDYPSPERHAIGNFFYFPDSGITVKGNQRFGMSIISLELKLTKPSNSRGFDLGISQISVR